MAPRLLADLSARPAGEAAAYGLIFLARVVGPPGVPGPLGPELARLATEWREGFEQVLAREGLSPTEALGPLEQALGRAVDATLDAAEVRAQGRLAALAAAASHRIRTLPATHPALVRSVLAPLADALREALARAAEQDSPKESP